MGIILKKETHHYLETYGFRKKSSNCIASCEECYEKAIEIHNGLYYMWIAIDLINKQIHYYIEYDCGGEISTKVEPIPTNISIDDEQTFMEWLDENATYYSNII